MILSCPDCATRYFVPDHSIGPQGRTVRCTACGFAWRAEGETTLDLVADEVEGAVAREPAAPPPEPDAPLSAPELPRAFRARAEERRRMRQAIVAGAVWAVLGAGFLALMASAWLFRVEVVELYPRAAAAYALVGVPVNVTGLEFEDVEARAAPDGTRAVEVSGRLRNVRGEPRVPPPVRVALLDGEGQVIDRRIVELSDEPVPPGHVRYFSVTVPDPRNRAADVDLVFMPDTRRSRPAAVTPRPAAPAPAPTPEAAPDAETGAGPPPSPAEAAGLRPTPGLDPAPIEARPLPAGGPLGLDSGADGAVTAPAHG